MDDQRDPNQGQNNNNANKSRGNKKKRDLSSTTSLGKRRTFDNRNRQRKQSPGKPATGYEELSPEARERPQVQAAHHYQASKAHQQQQQQQHQQQLQQQPTHSSSSSPRASTMSDPRSSEYGSQATLMRVPLRKAEEKPVKVAIIGASGGIGQPLSLLLMLHSEYIQHLALYDLAHVRGVGADLSHIDRQCKVTTHLGPEELPEAVKDTSVIVILAGIAQKPGMSRDDLFGTNAKIIFDLAKVCAQVAPEAHLAIVSNPVNSLVPIVNQVYHRVLSGGAGGPLQSSARQQQQQHHGADADQKHGAGHNSPVAAPIPQPAPGATSSPIVQHHSTGNSHASLAKHDSKEQQQHQQDSDLPAWCRRIFGVTTLDVVRASTLVAKSPFFTNAPPAAETNQQQQQQHHQQLQQNQLFKDPSKVTLPVVGGHAGKTILPLLSRANPKIDRKRLEGDMKLTHKIIESIQEAGIEVLNAKKGQGSATLAMAYSACRFTVSLLRAQLGETNIVECAYVRHPAPVFDNLDYFAMPLQLGKHGWVKALNPLTKALPFEQHMAEEAAKLLRANVARGEDFAKEHLSIEKN